MKCIRSGLLVVSALLLVACAPQQVKPWQRGDLARPEMAWDPTLMEMSQRQHTYTSKEAASGSGSLAGGGCGCN